MLAAASAAFLLFGMALIYAAVGTMEFGRMAELMTQSAGPNRTLRLAGLDMALARKQERGASTRASVNLISPAFA